MPVLNANQRFERYRIVQHVGSSASGESYEAEDIILHRKVILKLIHPWTTLSDAARRQFFREMQAISLLNHPYLTTVLDYGESEGQLYVVRRYARSGSLLSNEGRLWFTPPLPRAAAIHYTQQLAHTLAYVHQHGCLHGSLTFTNILIQRNMFTDGELHLAPFLLADVGLTHFVRRFGQPKTQLLPITAAPEQLDRQTTAASDQFALAVLLYFWLAGRPPYLGSPEEVEYFKRTATITPLTSLNTSVTTEQESILRRALAVRPAERYPSTVAFADALMTTLVSSSPTVSVPLPQPAISARLIISPYDAGEPYEFLLERDETMLGRAGSDDVLLQDTSTSRHHALLKREDDHYVIYDQRSTNGVFVNGQKLMDDGGYALVDGDHISIGNYELIFRHRVQKMACQVDQQPKVTASTL